MRGAVSIIAGSGGLGKSQIAALATAMITSGGMWPDGSRAQRGRVLFIEGEDAVDAVTKPRLVAAGADMSRVMFGKVKDYSDPAAIKPLEALRKKGLDLIVLSPIRSFFGPESYVEVTVRAKVAPLQKWAEDNGVAILGISHPPRGKRAIGGSEAWTSLARAGLMVEADKKGRRSIAPLKVNNFKDDWRYHYGIEEVVLGGVVTSKIVWMNNV